MCREETKECAREKTLVREERGLLGIVWGENIFLFSGKRVNPNYWRQENYRHAKRDEK